MSPDVACAVAVAMVWNGAPALPSPPDAADALTYQTRALKTIVAVAVALVPSAVSTW